jgi:hypothetical protein
MACIPWTINLLGVFTCPVPPYGLLPELCTKLSGYQVTKHFAHRRLFQYVRLQTRADGEIENHEDGVVL